MDQIRFDGRVVAVTGAGRGLGRAYARLIADRGGAVVVNDLGGATRGGGRSTAPADAVVAEIAGEGGRACANHQSVATAEGARSVIEDAIRTFGRLDALICNAGVIDPKPFEDTKVEDFERMLSAHFFGALLTIQAAWPHYKAQGYGRILTTVSPTLLGAPGFASYVAAKGAILGLTRTLATEAPEGVRINAISPGARTRMLDDTVDDPVVVERAARRLAPEMVAPVAAWLVHEQCMLNGEVVSARAGFAGRWLIGEADGFPAKAETPEAVAEHSGLLSATAPFTPYATLEEWQAAVAWQTA